MQSERAKPAMRRLYAIVMLLPLSKVVSFTVGCGPSQGSEGGSCYPAQSCHQDPSCDYGLVCTNDDTCVRTTPPPPPPGPCSDQLPSTRCAADELAQWCPAGTDSPIPASCKLRDGNDDGGTLFCCAPCWGAFGVCGDADAVIRCNAPHTPSERDPSLSCARVNIWETAGLSDYCCAASEMCFSIVDPDCAPDAQAHAYACSGDAAPADAQGACTAADAAGHYCCAQADGG